MGGVVELLPNNALCVDLESLAARIRVYADQLEAGELGEVERVVLISDGERVEYQVFGKQSVRAYTVGLLEWAKALVMGVLE